MSANTYPELEESNSRREAQYFGLAFLFLFLTAVALAVSPAARLDSWAALGTRLAPFSVLPVWIGSAWLIRRVLSRSKPDRDPILLPVAYLLSGWGTLEIWRLLPSFGARQTGWFILGTLVLVVVFRRPSDLPWLRRYRYLWLSSAILLTMLTLVFGTNPSGGEPHLWLGCCGLYFQPSELLRLLLIAYLASYLADQLRDDVQRTNWATLAPLWVIWGTSVALLAAQRDLGTGMLFVGLLAVLLYVAFGRWQILATAGGVTVVGGVLGTLFIGVVRLRVAAWLNPWADPIGNAYQIVQSLIAIASGGVFGSGPGFGSPGFVPAAHTDFIFSSITEEWGLLGAVGLLGLLSLLVSRGLRAAAMGRDRFSVMLASGVSIGFGLQSFLIMGGVLRLVPLTGVTLPFVSYGGSSLLTSLLGLAFLVHLSAGKGGTPRFDRPLRHVQLGFSLAWFALALALGWWTVVRAPALVSRFDNPRRALQERYSPRGAIIDRNGDVLAATQGTKGGYTRAYPGVVVAPLTGYDSRVYGQTGVELSMDDELRGLSGYPALTEWETQTVTGSPPPGLDVQLTADLNLQEAAMAGLDGQVGAVVILQGQTGKILALASSPSFDPGKLDQNWDSLTNNPDSPLLNRATQGLYQPGMAIAPFVLAWADQSNVADLGAAAVGLAEPISIDGRTLSCTPDPLRPRTLGSAALQGCPAPLQALGEQLGSASQHNMAAAFGFDRAPDIRLPTAGQAAPGQVGTPDPGMLAIGQAAQTVSPLQMARGFAALMQGGEMPGLSLVNAVKDPTGAWMDMAPLGAPERSVDGPAADAVRLLLTEPDGKRATFSARALTGSGETFGDLGWFMGSALDQPDVPVVVVVLEHSSPSTARSIGLRLLDLLGQG